MPPKIHQTIKKTPCPPFPEKACLKEEVSEALGNMREEKTQIKAHFSHSASMRHSLFGTVRICLDDVFDGPLCVGFGKTAEQQKLEEK